MDADDLLSLSADELDDNDIDEDDDEDEEDVEDDDDDDEELHSLDSFYSGEFYTISHTYENENQAIAAQCGNVSPLQNCRMGGVIWLTATTLQGALHLCRGCRFHLVAPPNA